MQNSVNDAAAQGETAEIETPMFHHQIGSTVYRVSVYFSRTSSETIEDKLLRLMKSEVHDIA